MTYIKDNLTALAVAALIILVAALKFVPSPPLEPPFEYIGSRDASGVVVYAPERSPAEYCPGEFVFHRVSIVQSRPADVQVLTSLKSLEAGPGEQKLVAQLNPRWYSLEPGLEDSVLRAFPVPKEDAAGAALFAGLVLLARINELLHELGHQVQGVFQGARGLLLRLLRLLIVLAGFIPAFFVSAQTIPLERVSFYQAMPNQTDSTPHLSACGPTKAPWVQVAVSRDLAAWTGGTLKCGTRVRVVLENRGVNGVHVIEGVVWDTMAPRWSRTVDVLIGVDEPAGRYGVRKRARLEVIGGP